ncbi:MAG: hypothetical protein PHO70_05270 [Candidatus Omnitrophica bacterium]|nr:hypothetical protein [Candidatus Omnitrophota bacterium]
MIKVSLIAAVFIFNMISLDTGFCQEKTEERERIIKTYSGQVTNVDWTGSLISVRSSDEKTFQVPSDVKIREQTEYISLSDIEIDDNVEISYYENSSGEAVAVSIVLNKDYPAF